MSGSLHICGSLWQGIGWWQPSEQQCQYQSYVYQKPDFSCYSWQGIEWQAINGSNLLLPAHNHDKNSTVVCVFSKVNAGSSLSVILSLWTVSESALFVSAYCCRQERTSMPRTMMAGHHCMLLFTGVRRTHARPLSTTYVTWTWKTMQYVPLFVKIWVCRFPAWGKKMHAGSVCFWLCL